MADTAEQTTPVVEETKEETPKVVEETTEEKKEETNGHTENGNGTTDEQNGEERVHKDADYKTEETAENGHKNGDAENGDSEEKVAEKRKAEDDAAPEPIPVSAEKIAKLTETTEDEVKEVPATS